LFTKENKCYFLEINPVGQFGFVSQNANHNIEQIIAKKLIQCQKERKHLYH